MKPKAPSRVKRGLTLEDLSHFVIYRELDMKHINIRQTNSGTIDYSESLRIMKSYPRLYKRSGPY